MSDIDLDEDEKNNKSTNHDSKVINIDILPNLFENTKKRDKEARRATEGDQPMLRRPQMVLKSFQNQNPRSTSQNTENKRKVPKVQFLTFFKNGTPPNRLRSANKSKEKHVSKTLSPVARFYNTRRDGELARKKAFQKKYRSQNNKGRAKNGLSQVQGLGSGSKTARNFTKTGIPKNRFSSEKSDLGIVRVTKEIKDDRGGTEGARDARGSGLIGNRQSDYLRGPIEQLKRNRTNVGVQRGNQKHNLGSPKGNRADFNQAVNNGTKITKKTKTRPKKGICDLVVLKGKRKDIGGAKNTKKGGFRNPEPLNRPKNSKNFKIPKNQIYQKLKQRRAQNINTALQEPQELARQASGTETPEFTTEKTPIKNKDKKNQFKSLDRVRRGQKDTPRISFTPNKQNFTKSVFGKVSGNLVADPPSNVKSDARVRARSVSITLHHLIGSKNRHYLFAEGYFGKNPKSGRKSKGEAPKELHSPQLDQRKTDVRLYTSGNQDKVENLGKNKIQGNRLTNSLVECKNEESGARRGQHRKKMSMFGFQADQVAGNLHNSIISQQLLFLSDLSHEEPEIKHGNLEPPEKPRQKPPKPSIKVDLAKIVKKTNFQDLEFVGKKNPKKIDSQLQKAQVRRLNKTTAGFESLGQRKPYKKALKISIKRPTNLKNLGSLTQRMATNDAEGPEDHPIKPQITTPTTKRGMKPQISKFAKKAKSRPQEPLATERQHKTTQMISHKPSRSKVSLTLLQPSKNQQKSFQKKTAKIAEKIIKNHKNKEELIQREAGSLYKKLSTRLLVESNKHSRKRLPGLNSSRNSKKALQTARGVPKSNTKLLRGSNERMNATSGFKRVGSNPDRLHQTSAGFTSYVVKNKNQVDTGHGKKPNESGMNIKGLKKRYKKSFSGKVLRGVKETKIKKKFSKKLFQKIGKVDGGLTTREITRNLRVDLNGDKLSDLSGNKFLTFRNNLKTARHQEGPQETDRDAIRESLVIRRGMVRYQSSISFDNLKSAVEGGKPETDHKRLL